MSDAFRGAYRNYHAVLGALTEATQSFAAGGIRLWHSHFPGKGAWASARLRQKATHALDRASQAIAPALVRVGTGLYRSRWAPLIFVRAIVRPLLTPWVGLAAIVVLLVVAFEMQTSRFEARYFSGLASEMSAPLKPGASTLILFPAVGPYDQRLGYAAIPRFVSRLTSEGYAIKEQARWSPGLVQFVNLGGFPVYREKDQGGLDILDRNGRSLYVARFPQTVYRDFASVPPLVVKSLLFTEDRYLLDRGHPERNAAIEWKRFGWAAFGRLARVAAPHFKAGGGSTLATQIEKFRHSPRGITDSAGEKLRQVLTASARMYLDGPYTLPRREQVVTTYLNSTPLASMPGYGEIIGIPDALSVWFGIANSEATRILNEQPSGPDEWTRKGEVYRDVLSLILSARRPDDYLLGHRDRLETLTNRYLRLLSRAGIIAPRLRDAALNARLHFRTQPPSGAPSAFSTERAVDSVRNNLVSLLKLPSLYGLDRLDLRVGTTTDSAAQERVSAFLARLSDPEFLQEQGMVGKQLLGDADPAKVTWSFVLYERAADHNELRVRADSLNQPFDINSGAKLMMGSTAKLRTLATYLEIVRELHGQLAQETRSELVQTADAAQDALTYWAASYLAKTHDHGLQPMLDAAMARHYSAAPGAFFTGSGEQGFGNFDKSENKSNPTVASAFEHSINLSFVRLLRDVVMFYEVQSVPTRARLLADRADPDRADYLHRFADEEGQSFLRRFYKRFATQTPDQMMAAIAAQTRPQAGPLAALYLAVHPNASFDELRRFLAARLPPKKRVSDDVAARVYRTDSPARLSLQDLGYVSGVHPLELWLARYRISHPSATWKQVVSASKDVRQQVYAWLFKGRLGKQDSRIRILLERAAFDRILEHWRSLGYPFGHLVPSLGTAVGASGDSPDALARLMGIILNGGVEMPVESLTQLRFAANTPYDTTLSRKLAPPVRVMAPEIARTLRGVLMGVVSEGTASRLRGAYVEPNGDWLAVGGKTGTGDNRVDKFTAGGGIIQSRTLDRTATFVFFLGDRFFGTVTAYVPAPEASRYHFSSALVVQLLAAMQPELQPLLGTARYSEAAPVSANEDTTND